MNFYRERYIVMRAGGKGKSKFPIPGRLLFGFYVDARRFKETAMRDILVLVADGIQESRERWDSASGETIRRLM
jgi:hypothetical protein